MLSIIEVEVVLLKAVWDQVDQAVNRSLFDVTGHDPESEIRFHSSVHQRLFNIILVDFLSKTDKRAPLRATTYLSGLRDMCADPQLGTREDAVELVAAVGAFTRWLEEEIEVDVWLPTLPAKASLAITRAMFLKMTGDLSKHNFLRTFGVASELSEALSRSGLEVSVEDASLALPDFFDRFHSDILNYHSATIAEFLNNIRWGVFAFLRSEFGRSIRYDSTNPVIYEYTYPAGVTTEFARRIYWDLMNQVREEPRLPKFSVTKWLKLRY